VAAHVDFNQNPQSEIKGDDYYSLLVWQNFCIENLNRIRLQDQSNKKASDQQKEFNELMNIMAFLVDVLDKMHYRIIQEYYSKEKQTENEILEKQYVEERIRTAEFKQYEEVNAALLAAQKAREEEYLRLKEDLTKQKSILEDLLNVTENKIKILESMIVAIDKEIVDRVQKIVNEVIESRPPLEFQYGGEVLNISNSELKEGIRKENQEKPISTEDDVGNNAKNALKKIVISKAAQKGIKVTTDFLEQAENFAVKVGNEVSEAFHIHGDRQALEEMFSKKASYVTDLEMANQERDELKTNIVLADQNLVILEQGYNALNQANNAEEREHATRSLDSILHSANEANINISSFIADREAKASVEEINAANEEVVRMDFFGDDDEPEPEVEESPQDQPNDNDAPEDEFPPPSEPPPADLPPPNEPPIPYHIAVQSDGLAVEPVINEMRPPEIDLLNDRPPGGAPLPLNELSEEKALPAQNLDVKPDIPDLHSENKSNAPQPKSSASFIFQQLGARPAPASEMAARESQSNLRQNVNEQKERKLDQQANNLDESKKSEDDNSNRPRRLGH
jgi:hypothetical protein